MMILLAEKYILLKCKKLKKKGCTLYPIKLHIIMKQNIKGTKYVFVSFVN